MNSLSCCPLFFRCQRFKDAALAEVRPLLSDYMKQAKEGLLASDSTWQANVMNKALSELKV